MNLDFDRENLVEYAQKNPLIVLALALILLLLMGYLVFTFRILVPRWRQRTELLAASATAEAALADRSTQQQAAAGGLGQQLETAQAEFAETANRFLTEAQAAAFLADLYDSAMETAVFIVDLQAQAVPQDHWRSF